VAKPARLVQEKSGPPRRTRVVASSRAPWTELPLQRLRQTRARSQQQLAEALDITQPEISKLEHRTDLYVSTLRRYVKAMGGVLKITAHFPDGTAVRVGRFGDLEEPR
jgi:Helix-turn-helix domain